MALPRIESEEPDELERTWRIHTPEEGWTYFNEMSRNLLGNWGRSSCSAGMRGSIATRRTSRNRPASARWQ